MKMNGRSFSSETVAEKTDGVWAVTVRLTERLRLEGEDWKDKSIESVCYDNLFAKAYEVALLSVMEQFNDTIAKTGNDSLFEEFESKES